MPIIVRRDNPGDLAELSRQAGSAAGNAERAQRQQQIDAQFMNQALARSTGRSGGAYGTNPGDYGYNENFGPGSGTEPAYRGRSRGGSSSAEDDSGVQTFVNEDARASASAQAQIDAEKAAARKQAETIAQKRQLFAQASQAGPDALAQFLAADSYATTGKVPDGLIDKLAPDVKAAGAQGSKAGQPRATGFQGQVGTALQSGNVSAIGYLGEKKPATYDPSAPPGTAPVALPTERAIEAANALTQTVTSMAPAALKQLRGQIAAGPISAQAKTEALRIVDGQIEQTRKMRDVEIAQVYDDVISKASQAILAVKPGVPLAPRDQQRRTVGKRAMEIAKQYGISPAEFMDWISRQNSAMDAMQDANNPPAPPAPGSAPAGSPQKKPAPAPAGR